MIKWEHIKPELVPILKEFEIEEKDLFNHESDLYVGCRNIFHAALIKTKTNPENGDSIAGPITIFIPQKGSDMELYGRAIDFAFCYYGP